MFLIVVKRLPQESAAGAFVMVCLVEASELFAGEDVEMDMVHRLAGQLADVGDHAVAVGEALPLGEL